MSVVGAVTVRRASMLASSGVLIVLSGLSYGTSLVRELVLVGSEYGTESLDSAMVVLAAATVAGSTLGLAAQMTWGTGRSARTLRLGYWMLPAAGLVMLPFVGWVPLLAGVLAALLSDYHLLAQQAANRERLHLALIGSLFASLLSVVLWRVIGANSVEAILGGYVAGGAFQLTIAYWAGARATPKATAGGIGPSRSVVVASLALCHGLVAKVLLLGFETGIIAAASLAFNAISALSVILAYPFASAVLAGRKQMKWTFRAVAIASVACGLLGLALASVFELEGVNDSRLAAGAASSLHILGIMSASLPFVVTTGVLLRTPAVLERKGPLLIVSLMLSLVLHCAVGWTGVASGSIVLTVFAFVVAQAVLPAMFVRGGRASRAFPEGDR